MTAFLSAHYLPWILGLVFAVLVAHPFVVRAADAMWTAAGLDPLVKEQRPSPWQPKAEGLTERALFAGSILVGQPGFIAVWLAVKTAVHWSVFGKTAKGVGNEHAVSPREIHSNFLLGLSISIAFAAAGGYGVLLLQDRRPIAALLLGLAVIGGTLALTWWIRREGARYLEQLKN